MLNIMGIQTFVAEEKIACFIGTKDFTKTGLTLSDKDIDPMRQLPNGLCN